MKNDPKNVDNLFNKNDQKHQESKTTPKLMMTQIFRSESSSRSRKGQSVSQWVTKKFEIAKSCMIAM